jgi:acyl dehydratase
MLSTPVAGRWCDRRSGQAMNLQAVRNLRFSPLEISYEAKDSILYALGLGFGDDPVDPLQLQFVYEKGLRAVPSMSVPLADPGFWQQRPEFEIDWRKIVHAEQRLDIHAPLPPTGRVRGQSLIRAVSDKGTDSGAILYQEKQLFDAVNGKLLATTTSTVFLRGDGGCGNLGTAPPRSDPLPVEASPVAITLTTTRQSALLYRLSGDFNPMHADPSAARASGFERPLLHGLCTYGMAARALIQVFCDGDPDILKSLFVRFSSPVFPGESIRFEFYPENSQIRFRARVVERNAVVLDRCTASVKTV